MDFKSLYNSIKKLSFDDAVEFLLNSAASTNINVDIDDRSKCIILKYANISLKLDYTFGSEKHVASYCTEKISEDVEVVDF